MMCDFNKTFFTPKEEIQKQCECIQALLTHEKVCCVCANSEKRLDTEMGYITFTTWCKISGEYVDYKCGKNCPSWKSKYPQHEKEVIV